MSTKIRIGISQGDLNGVGLEVILKTFNDPALEELCTPVLFSSQKSLSFHRKALGIEDSNFHITKELDQLNPKKPNLINLYEEDVAIELGKASAVAGKYALLSLNAASEALLANKVDVLVTAPINKHTMASEGFPFKGHTEYLDRKLGKGNGDALMIMVSDAVKVALVTGHVPLQEVAPLITPDRVMHKLKTFRHSLLQDFGIRKPKIAVLGLNPHAGDLGTIGKEDIEIITPTVQKAFAEGIMAFGPYPADGFFGSGNYKHFDGVLAMYHDQGLVPFKTLSFNNGVNFTAGIQAVRTSPDHGTGYDIAGKNKASEASFRQAIYLAIDVFRKRNEYKGLVAHPLKVTTLRKEQN